MAKADPRKFEGPIAARYGDRLKEAALDAAQAAPVAAIPHQQPEQTLVGHPLRVAETLHQEGESRFSQGAAAAYTTSIRVVVTMAERDELDSLLNGLSKAVGARVKLANVMRACINQLVNAEAHIVARANRARQSFVGRPANGDALALARFEDQLREVVEAGLIEAARKVRTSP